MYKVGHRVCVLGRNGTGKTTFINQLQKRLKTKYEVTNFDILHNYHDSFKTTNAAYDIEKISSELYMKQKKKPCMLIFDEIQMLINNSNLDNFPNFKNYALTGRNYGCGYLIASNRPSLVNKNLLGNCNTYFILGMDLNRDIQAIKETLGSNIANAVQNLKEFHFIYVNSSDKSNYKVGAPISMK